VLTALDRLYDFVLMDSPPLIGGAGSHLLARFADAVLLVIRAGTTTSAQLAEAVAPLEADKLFGVVLNRIAR
jgi:succinoglycan biosynthesis transport protein ExoP